MSYLCQVLSYFAQMSFDGDLGFSPRPTDISNITLSRDLQVGYSYGRID